VLLFKELFFFFQQVSALSPKVEKLVALEDLFND
jgi:hypothetical protein